MISKLVEPLINSQFHEFFHLILADLCNLVPPCAGEALEIVAGKAFETIAGEALETIGDEEVLETVGEALETVVEALETVGEAIGFCSCTFGKLGNISTTSSTVRIISWPLVAFKGSLRNEKLCRVKVWELDTEKTKT